MFGSSAPLFFRHSVYLWAIQSFICTVRQPLRICISLTLTCRSISLKSGCQTLNQAVIPWLILCSVTVSQSVILCSVSVSQSVSQSFYVQSLSFSQWVILCSVIVSQSVSYFMFSHCQSVSQSFMFLIICLSVSQWVIYVPHHLSVSQSVSHLCSSFVCQWVSESFYLQYLSVSRLVILCSVSVCQSVSQSFYVQYLSVSHFMFSIS